MANVEGQAEACPIPVSGLLGETSAMREAISLGLLEFVPDAVVIVDAEGRIRLVNAQAERMFGYGRDELLGMQVEVLLPDQFRGIHAEHRGRYHARPGIRPMGAGLDLAARRKDGGEIPVEISLGPLETGEGVLITCVIRDITDRRRTQRELENRVDQQAIVAELGRQALLGTDLAKLMDLAVTLVAGSLRVDQVGVLELLPGNEAFLLRAGVGWKEGDVGKATLEVGTRSHAGYTLLSNEPLVVADLDAETRFEAPPLLRDHGVVSVSSVILHVQDRPYGVLDAHASRPQAFSGDDMNFLQAIANVLAAAVERKRGEQLQRERDLLRAEHMAAVGQVAAGVAHELRNPLTAIKGLVQVNRKEAESCGLPAEDLRVIEDGIRRMEGTLRTFLEFARPPEPERHAQDLGVLVDRILTLIRGRAEGQGVAVEVTRPPEPVVADVDGDQFQQLLLNLAMNALDAMPRGGTLRVEVRPPAHGEAEIRVIDSGPGLSADLLPRAFEPFVSGKKEGLGLGLAICRRIAEEHGGRLDAWNRPEGGACFALHLTASPPG